MSVERAMFPTGASDVQQREMKDILKQVATFEAPGKYTLKPELFKSLMVDTWPSYTYANAILWPVFIMCSGRMISERSEVGRKNSSILSV